MYMLRHLILHFIFFVANPLLFSYRRKALKLHVQISETRILLIAIHDGKGDISFQ
jgi:hypothetical protein